MRSSGWGLFFWCWGGKVEIRNETMLGGKGGWGGGFFFLFLFFPSSCFMSIYNPLGYDRLKCLYLELSSPA